MSRWMMERALLSDPMRRICFKERRFPNQVGTLFRSVRLIQMAGVSQNSRTPRKGARMEKPAASYVAYVAARRQVADLPVDGPGSRTSHVVIDRIELAYYDSNREFLQPVYRFTAQVHHLTEK